MKFIRPESPTRHPAPGTRHPAPGTRHPVPGCYALAVAAALAVLTAASCTKRNPYKCNLAEPCPLAEAPFCDIQGDFGDPYHCVAQPALDGGPSDGGPDSSVSTDDAGPDAMLDAQMVDAAVCGGNVCTDNTPVCNMATGLCRACGLAPADCGTGRYCAPSGACVECLTTSQCTTAATRPLCETTTSMCRGCATPGECAAVNSLTPQCKSNGACVGCTASTQCGNGNTPICSTADNCVACSSGAECAAKNPTLPQCAGSGACVQCLASAQCGTATQPICASNSCRGCQGSTECVNRGGATPPVCKTTTGACVQCLGNTDCGGATPVCDTTPNTCRACRADTECSSGVCDEVPGTCVPETNVLFVALGGSAGSCTQAAPCATIAQALSQLTAVRNTILVAQGTYPANLSITSQVRIVGTGTGADIRPSDPAPPQPLIGVNNSGALTLENAVVQFSPTGQDAVSCNGGRVTLSRVLIFDNGGLGVYANGCTLVVDRTTVFGNRGGGIELLSSSYDITNSFVIENGRTTGGVSAVGGVRFGQPGLGTLRFVNNTIAGNIGATAAGSAGIICPGALPVSMANNIVWGNSGAAQFVGMCAFSNSDVQGIGPTNGNLNADPLFAAPASANYHITVASPCRSTGNNTGAPDHDFDGEARPRPAATNVDIGADEIP